MVNPWIEHVRKFASKKGIPYFEALKHKDVKKGYKSKAMGGSVYSVNDEEDDFSMGEMATALPPATTGRRK